MPGRSGDSDLISVVIPTHNRCALLGRTVAGVLRQTGVSLEVIVVDDGSTDDTRASLEALGDDRVRVVRNETATGVGRARNAGLEVARGEWVAFLDDDDVWAPEKLRRQMDALDRSSADFAYAGVVYTDTAGQTLEIVPAPAEADLPRLLHRYCAIPCPCSNVLARTEVVRRMGGFAVRFPHLADWDFALRLSDGARGVACHDYLIGYTIHPTNMAVTDDGAALREFRELRLEWSAHPMGEIGDIVTFTRYLAKGQRRGGNHRGAARLYLLGARQGRNPGSAVRAVGVLFGEGVMTAVGRLPRPGWRGGRGTAPELPAADLDWLQAHRIETADGTVEGGDAASS